MKKLGMTVAIFILVLIVGCTTTIPPEDENSDQGSAGNNSAASNTVSGTITVRDLIDTFELPKDAVIQVQLVDISIADAASVLIAEQIYRNEAQLPIQYAVEFDRNLIEEGLTYAVQVSVIDSAGNLLFINDTIHPALTQGAGAEVNVELIVVNAPSKPESGKSNNLLGTQWQLRAFSLVDEWVEPLEGAAPTLMFEDETINGNAGCNRYFGGLTLEGDSLSIGQLGSTRMMCEEDVMQAETAYLESLEQAQSYSIEENSLMIEIGGGAALIFDRVEPSN